MKKAGIVISLTLMLGLVSPTVASADNYSCDATGVILGTNGADVIQGTSGADVICALGGDDEINGLGGDDVIIGGEGDDEVIGDDGVDILYGGPGADRLFGSADADKLYGGDGKDRLDGGLAKDYLDGESGVNTCIKSAGADTYRNCYYDSAGPSLVSAAIDPEYATLDASAGQSYVILKIVISDPGVGFAWGGLSFRNFGVTDSKTSRVGASLEPDQNPGCLPQEKSIQQRISNGWSIFCRESGDELLGTYRVGFSLPKGSIPGKWSLNSIELTDKVRNTRSLDFAQLKAKALNINFRQIGADPNLDALKPAITSVKLLTAAKSSSTNRNFKYQIKFSKVGSGLNQVHFGFTNTNFKWNIESHLGITGFFSKGQECFSDGGELEGKVCLVSGTLNAGILEISGVFSEAIAPGTWSFDSIGLVDKEKNSTQLTWEKISKKAQASLSITKTWGADFSDSTSPEIVNLSWSKTQIDTGSADQTFEISIRVKDKTGLAGFDKSGILFAIFPHFDWVKPGTSASDSIYFKYTVDRISGSAVDGVYKLIFTVPAHSKQGTIHLKSIEVRDSSPRQNNGGLSYEQLVAKGWQTSISNKE